MSFTSSLAADFQLARYYTERQHQQEVHSSKESKVININTYNITVINNAASENIKDISINPVQAVCFIR
jgi:hypothetical protein